MGLEKQRYNFWLRKLKPGRFVQKELYGTKHSHIILSVHVVSLGLRGWKKEVLPKVSDDLFDKNLL